MSEKVEKIVAIHYLTGKNVEVLIRNGKIDCINEIDGEKNSFKEKIFIAPGLIDNQVNGFNGVDFSGPGLTVEDVEKVVRGLYQFGVTSFLATVVTSPVEVMKENLSVIAEAMKIEEIGRSIPGIHLEGPFLCPENGFRGAHNPAWLRSPDWEFFRQLNAAAEGRITQVTIAPELDGAIDFIQKCSKQGIVVGIGHHNGTAEDIRRAADAGAAISTHLGNACANYIHRHKNPLWPQLAEDRLMASIIVDGHHLSRDEVNVFFRAKGMEQIVLISDMTKFAGLQPGKYSWNGVELEVTDSGIVRLVKENMLAGAAFPLDHCVNKMMEFTGCSLAEVIAMASFNPARLNGLFDRGSIEPDKRADLIIFSLENGKMKIKQTIVAGEIVFQRE
ncbi:MAG: N-acetylglucosamine-6-phosphate deacetylase [Calditrichaeota bacterium]|nr:N-acetylglucosamine-6-phosphate deacetylase [Calditrichota bacterium]